MFNQPLTFDTSSVTDMHQMFQVRSARALAPSLESGNPRACRLHYHYPTPSPRFAHALPSTRQGANSLSNANKLLIRCAWAGTSAFASAGYGSSWGPGTCPVTFTSKAELQTAVRAYNANPTAATVTYGPIAGWDVSAITEMRYLFYNLKNFNADISNWNTSSVTNMYGMFLVRCARALAPQP